jgi:hypothetical protein
MFFSSIISTGDVYPRAYNGEGCRDGDLEKQFRSEGRRDVCHGDNQHYKSGKYFFAGKKMTRGIAVERDTPPENCVKPDTLYFADDSAYHIADLTDAQVEELVCYFRPF